LEELRQRPDRPAREVHVAAGSCDDYGLPVDLRLAGQRVGALVGAQGARHGCEVVQQLIDGQVADVVPGGLVLGARVTEPNDEPRGIRAVSSLRGLLGGGVLQFSTHSWNPSIERPAALRRKVWLIPRARRSGCKLRPRP